MPTPQSEITLPVVTASQHVNLQAVAHSTVTLPFDPSLADFVRDGNNLVIATESGGSITVSNFFSADNEELPTFTLANGTQVAGKDFLLAQSPDMDVETAAGPTAVTVSSGLEAYDNGSADLLGGVDTLASVNNNWAWSSAITTAEQSNTTTALLLQTSTTTAEVTPVSPIAPTVPVTPVEPTQPVTPVEPPSVTDPINPEIRLVLYADAADINSWANGTTTSPLPHVATVTNGTYGNTTLLADGSLHYAPSLDNAEWPEDGSPIIDSIIVTMADGSKTKIEVLLVNGKEISTEGYAPVSGEWHEGLLPGMYTVQSGNGNDVFVRQYGSTSLATGSTINMGQGHDVVRLTAQDAFYGNHAYGMANNSHITMGNDASAVYINATGNSSYAYGTTSTLKSGADQTSIVFGAGNDLIDVTASSSRYAVGVHNTAIHMGNGDNTIKISTTGLSGNTYTYGIEGSTITAGNGNDTLTVTTNKGNAITGSTINLGEGDNTVLLSNNSYSLVNATLLTGAGKDYIEVSNTIPYSSQASAFTGSTSVRTGAGDDTIRINLSGTSTVNNEALLGTAVDMGDGNDLLDLSMKFVNHAGGINSSANINMGAGDDTVNMNLTTTGNGHFITFGAHNGSTINLGSGNNTFTLVADAKGNSSNTSYVYGLASNATLSTLDGNNDLSITGSSHMYTAGKATVEGLTSANIRTGNGNDTLAISATATSTTEATARGAYALYAQSSSINLKNGANELLINAQANGGTKALAQGLSNITLTTGQDADMIHITATATDTNAANGIDATANGIIRGLVTTGDGNDTLNITVTSNGDAYGIAQGVNGSNITLGTSIGMGLGHDELNLTVTANNNAYGVNSSTVDMSDGDDHAVITVNGAHAFAVNNSTIHMGEGNNQLTIIANGSVESQAVVSSTIAMGAGNDFLSITGDISGNSSIATGHGNDTIILNGHIDASLGNMVIDSGYGDDHITLGANFGITGTASITGNDGFDVLHLSSDLTNLDFSSLGGSISGIEQIDLLDGQHNITLSLNDLVALTNNGSGQDAVLRIVGGADDQVTLAGSGWTVNTSNTVSLTDHQGGMQDFYTASNDGATVYIESHLLNSIFIG